MEAISTLGPKISGESFRAVRESVGWTINYVAYQLGRDPSTIRNWEKGRSDVDPNGYSALIALRGEELKRRASQGDVALISELMPEEGVPLPLLGDIVGGEPDLAAERLTDVVRFPSEVVSRVRGRCFALRVVGDSMAPAGIPAGSHVAVAVDMEPADGDIVAATLPESGGSTLKRLVLRGGRRFLVAAAEGYPAIPADDAIIHGVVKGALTTF